MSKVDEIWPFDDRSLDIQITVFSTWFILLEPGSKYSGLMGIKSAFNSLYLDH